MNAIRIAVLISGNGSNLQAILDACQAGEINGEVVAVVSNKADVYGLTRAEEAGVPALVVAPQAGESREDYDARLEAELNQLNVDLVVLAGFMRILSEGFVNRFAGRMLNIHPSLLPKYTGLNTHQRALDAGDEEHGCSVHFVTPELDGGPVILQAKVPVFEGDDADDLAERVHTQEHRIYPLVVKWFAQGRLAMTDGKALFNGEVLPVAGYASED
ncbi:phosphoribosylglycinamide formyltransferase [Ferrimonas balearica]|uniref:phosphoribosylglycinamide formyltransferase n=1 Tax=Ferrimonas balearica TaxID=44012 RepID=UPI001C57EE16|nr:phosphoribosylglycinamide formyltransferase [Ferrimonas balearica]MBW3164081.1 phosphoribosylglycinamide formyltransferase [Ferrimonas balearica]MBY5979117.1 phosphoribosylglycinamide formyltransferase [Ferrimonas balearica]MBY6224063.1 phosphoribosylglycinamide formyltransferase [Ferrimonas balearica]